MNLEPQIPEMPTPPTATLVAPPLISPSAIPAAAPTKFVWGFWLTLAFGALVAGAFVAVQSVIAIIFIGVYATTGHKHSVESLSSDGLLVSVATCCSAPVVVGLSVFLAWLRRGLPVKAYFALKPVTLKMVLLSFAALIGVYILWAAAVKFFNLPEIPQFMLDVYRTARFLPLLWVAIVLAAPAAEECLFRGFLFQGLMHSRVGPTGAVVLTSFLWAVIHLQYGWVEITFIFLLGLALGCIRWKSGSIWLPFLIHSVSNLIATLELALLDK